MTHVLKTYHCHRLESWYRNIASTRRHTELVDHVRHIVGQHGGWFHTPSYQPDTWYVQFQSESDMTEFLLKWG